ncbi:MAG: PAS domain-containing protein [Rhodospirillaceae bacterium]|nr:PAS domain-containing protein [Rhodospirillaceae bacterium]MBT7756747.1 PAS domain-containing protein [Rhodospirillaceae bacterium]
MRIVELLEHIQSEDCRAFVEAWQKWRGSDLVPRRAQVRLDDIAPQLPWLSLLEVKSKAEAIYRLSGSLIDETLGINLTGKNFIETAPPEQRALRGERTWAVATAPCGSLFQIPIEYTSGRRLPSEIISLPVAPDDPGAAMQTFSICAIADNTLVERPSIAPGHIPMSQEYRFIDIGAGIPDPSEGLGGDSHPTL